MTTGTVLLIVLLGGVGFVALYGVVLYNRLVGRKNQVAAAWSQIDVQLKRRHDLIPNLVEVAKDYMDYEQETLQRVIQARSQAVSAREQGPEASMQAEGLLGAALGKLFALAEDYPDLKADGNLSRLQEELASTENRIAFARQHYNDSVMVLNTLVETFPAVIVANSFNFAKAVFFEVPDGDLEPVKVDLR